MRTQVITIIIFVSLFVIVFFSSFFSFLPNSFSDGQLLTGTGSNSHWLGLQNTHPMHQIFPLAFPQSLICIIKSDFDCGSGRAVVYLVL